MDNNMQVQLQRIASLNHRHYQIMQGVDALKIFKYVPSLPQTKQPPVKLEVINEQEANCYSSSYSQQNLARMSAE